MQADYLAGDQVVRATLDYRILNMGALGVYRVRR